MEGYFAARDLKGFTNFFDVQVQEERAHAKLFFDFIIRMNGEVSLGLLEKPASEFQSNIDVFKKAYDHEKYITSRIYKLMDIATEEREHATTSFLKWFVDEQVEEEETFSGIIKRLEPVGNSIDGLFMLDTELAGRVFTPPTILKSQQ
jgi:ferritin